MKLTKYLSVLALAIVSMTSCEAIPENERYIELPRVEAKRAVLLEDFTGQVCKNCPFGHEVIASLQKQYGEGVIAVAIHAGPLSWGETMQGVTGLGNATGAELATRAGVTTYPSGRVDRTGGLLQYESWSSAVASRISTPTPLKIELEGGYDAKSGNIVISSLLASSEGGEYRLHVWITESGIIAPQILPDGQFNMEYTHSHVLRHSVTAIEGEKIPLAPQAMIEGKTTFSEIRHTISAKENWNTGNLHVVAFVEKDGEVFNASEKKITVLP